MKKSTPKTTSSKKTTPKPALSKAKKKAPVKKVAAKTPLTGKKAATPKATVKKAVNKAPGKKAAIRKIPATKTSTKKIAAKKVIAKKPTPNKVIAKTSIAKKAPAKKTSVKAVPKATKDDIRKTIASLESRMKQADTLTRKSVKALESAVMALDARTRKDSTTGKAALTRKVNQLSAKLTDMVAKTQDQVNTDLKTALKNPSVENIQNALSRADQRLSLAEQAQAAAISKVNHHLSAIATAVDARIEDETKARKAAIAALQAETQNNHTALGSRIDTIEADTAQALSRVGDKIADLSSELTQRGTTSEISIREKVSEIALQTQTEFETYRAGLDRRIDDVAQRSQSADTQHLEHSIAELTARLESLEYAVAHPVVAEVSNYAAAPAPVAMLMAAPSAPQLSLVPPQAAPMMATPITASPQTHEPQLPDAFSPLSQVPEARAAAMSNPYLTGQAQTAPVVVEPHESHHPVEFDPASFTAPQQSTPQLPPPPAPNEEPIRDFTQTQPAPIAPPADLTTLPPIATDSNAIPYADPAYAETDPTMAGLRIGGNEGKTESKLNLPKLTGRNLRIAAITTGVAVVGLVAAKGVFNGNDDTAALPQKTIQQATPQNNIAPVAAPKPDTSAEPIGDYADNKAVDVPPSSQAAKTLNSAAAAGDPVAQFQLGLSYLEQGRTDEGVSLVRKSANQNQPAAQYRLAKLYEIGEGVSQDAEMARQLTERAATNGNRIAMHDLALYYAEGRGGVDADLPTAAKWFEKAAERGVVDSQFNLGVLFESGQGIPKNMNDAFVWYSIAAEQGDQFAKTRIDVLRPTFEQSDLVSSAARIKQYKPRNIDEAANGIFRNVAWGKSNNNADEKISQVKQVQTMLAELGYDIGGADGSIGPKTRAAIMSFERVNSLPETGRVNSALTDRLELATGA